MKTLLFLFLFSIALADDPVADLAPSSVTIKFEAAGMNLTFQWMKGDKPIPGETKPEIVLSPTASGLYWLVATDSLGRTVSSGRIRLSATTVTGQDVTITTFKR